MTVLRHYGLERNRQFRPLDCPFVHSNLNLNMRFFICLLMLLLSQFSYSQIQLSGKVLDTEKEPCIGAIVEIQNKSAVANAAGQFEISGLKKGESILKITYGVYKWEERLDLQKDREITIEMKRSVVYDAIIVEGTRVDESMPFTHVEVKEDEIEDQSYGQDVPFILKWKPSMVVTSDAGTGIGYTGMRIRGSDPTRINVTINGIPLNDAESQAVFWVNTPDLLASASDVQIQRGVGTSTNGAGAFGASVHLNLNKFSQQPYGRVEAGLGSFNTYRFNTQLSTGLLNDHWYFEGRLSRISSDGYIDRGSAELRSEYLSGRYLYKNGSVRAYYFGGNEVTYQAWNGVPVQYVDNDSLRTFNSAGTERPGEPYEDEVDNYGQDHYQLHWDHDWGNINTTLSFHYTKGAGFFEQYMADASFSSYNLDPINIGGEIIDQTDLIQRRWLDNDFYGSVFSAEWRPGAGRSIQFGGAYHRYKGRHFGEVIWAQFLGDDILEDHIYYDNDAVKTDANVYVKWTEEVWRNLNFFVDLQVRNILYEFRGVTNEGQFLPQDDRLTFFNPKAGFTKRWQNGDQSYLSFALGQREPNRDDYTENPPSQRPSPEKLYNLEAGHSLGWQSGGLELTAYYMYYEDQLILTGEINNVGEYSRTNVPSSYRLGLEVAFQQQLNTGLDLYGNLTLSRNRINEFSSFVDNWDTGEQIEEKYSNTPIAFSPNVIAAAGLKYDVYTYQTANGKGDIGIEWQHKYVGQQFLDNTGSDIRSLDAYYYSDIHLRWDSPIGSLNNLGVQLVVRNIWNNLYETNGWTYRYRTESFNPVESDPYSIAGARPDFYNQIGLYPQAGINFLLTVGLEF